MARLVGGSSFSDPIGKADRMPDSWFLRHVILKGASRFGPAPKTCDAECKDGSSEVPAVLFR
jgi:hypothetical protein